MFNQIQGSSPLIRNDFHGEHNPPYRNDLFRVNQKFMGGGMSQNYAALYFFEYYISNYNFEYVLEIGTQKGALSLYLANLANVTEKFIFHTVDISTGDYYCRETEGVGHWLDKLNEISNFSQFFKTDIFDSFGSCKNMIGEYKSLIFCDGGNKAREFNMFAEMIKPGDHIILHDWGTEVKINAIELAMEKHNVYFNEPYVNSCNEMGTLLMPFIKI